MHWLAVQLGTSTLAALNSILDKHMARYKLRSCLYLAAFGMVGAPVALLGAIGLVPRPALTDLVFALVGGLCFAVAIIIYYRTVGLDEEEISRLTPLLRLSSLFVLLISALLFGERLHLYQYHAFIAMLVGSGLLALKPDKGRFRFSRGAFLMLAVSALLAIYSTLVAQLYHRYPLLTAFVAEQTGVTVGAAFVLFLVPGKRQLVQQMHALPPLLRGVVVGEQVVRLLIGFLSAYVLTQVGSAALTSVMGGLRSFLVLLLAHWLLGEPLDRRALPPKLVGLGCMSVGVALLAI